MKQLDSYKKFKKVVRKYWKRHVRKSICILGGRRRTTYWFDTPLWCYYLLKAEDYQNSYITRDFRWEVHLEEIDTYIENILPLINKHVIVYNQKDEVMGSGIFKGAATVNTGVMLVVDNDSRNFYYCNVKLKEYERQ